VTDETQNTEKATFGAGCFWQVEEEYRCIEGVIETAVGYEGGHVDNPTYEQVCSGITGHVEVCQVTFDPGRVSYEELVSKYFEIHDPTQLNRQGPDVGYQYRSVIFAHSDEQAETARRVIEHAQRAVLARRGVPPVLPAEATGARRAALHPSGPLGA
jgi:peptide-methionine (S)-S-oxide reductase